MWPHLIAAMAGAIDPIEFVEIHRVVQGLFGFIKDSIEFGLFCISIKPGVTFFQRPPGDSKIFAQLRWFKPLGSLGLRSGAGAHRPIASANAASKTKEPFIFFLS